MRMSEQTRRRLSGRRTIIVIVLCFAVAILVNLLVSHYRSVEVEHQLRIENERDGR